VDDEEIIRRVLRSLLKKDGYEVIEAEFFKEQKILPAPQPGYSNLSIQG